MLPFGAVRRVASQVTFFDSRVVHGTIAVPPSIDGLLVSAFGSLDDGPPGPSTKGSGSGSYGLESQANGLTSASDFGIAALVGFLEARVLRVSPVFC